MDTIVIIVTLALVFAVSYFCGVRLRNCPQQSPEREDVWGLAMAASSLIGIVGGGIAGNCAGGIQVIAVIGMIIIGLILSWFTMIPSLGLGYLSGHLWRGR